MRITEKKLRKLIRQTILEAADPNDPERGKRIFDTFKNVASGAIPYADQIGAALEIGKGAFGMYGQSKKAKMQNELYGFVRACEKAAKELSMPSKSDMISEDLILKYFNKCLQEEGVLNYTLKREIGTEAGLHTALDPSIIKK